MLPMRGVLKNRKTTHNPQSQDLTRLGPKGRQILVLFSLQSLLLQLLLVMLSPSSSFLWSLLLRCNCCVGVVLVVVVVLVVLAVLVVVVIVLVVVVIVLSVLLEVVLVVVPVVLRSLKVYKYISI